MRRVNVVACRNRCSWFPRRFRALSARRPGSPRSKARGSSSGDGGAPIENATLVVDGAQDRRGRQRAEVSVPAGATRVNLAGKTVMPMLIDTHMHLSPTREALIARPAAPRLFRRRRRAEPRHWTSTSCSIIRAETMPGAARFLSAGRGITMPEPGRIDVPYWITTEAEGRKAVQELAAQKVDIVKIWVDTATASTRSCRRKSTARSSTRRTSSGLRVTAHIFDLEDAKGLIKRRHRCVRARRSRQDIDDELVAMFKERPNLVLDAEPAGPRREDGSELAARRPAGRRAGEARGGEHRQAAGSRRSTASRRATWRSSMRPA